MLWTRIAQAQGEARGGIRGVVNDQDFSVPVPQARVVASEIALTVQTSDDGHFIMRDIVPGTYTLVISKEGYRREVRTGVVVLPGRLAEMEVNLAGEYTEMEEMVVRDLETATGADAGILNVRQNSAAAMDAVGADTISRAGQSTVAGALKLVAGASVEEGKYAVIRGLGDRYTSTQINGVRLPSADPEKRAVQLDQFPTAMIDGIQVTKTFMPDQQGDSGAGAINIVTKPIPDESFVSGKFSRGYRQGITGNSGVKANDRRVDTWGVEHRELPIRSFDIPTLSHKIDGTVDETERQVDQLTRSLDPNVGTVTRAPPWDFGWNASLGHVAGPKDGWQLGGLAAFSYSRKYDGYTNAVKEIVRSSTTQGTGLGIQDAYHEAAGAEHILWGRMVSVGLSCAKEQEIGITYLQSHAADNYSIEQRRDIAFPDGNYNLQNVAYKEILDYTERGMETLQAHGRHRLMALEGQPWGPSAVLLHAPVLEWTSSRNTSTLNEPDRTETIATLNTSGDPTWTGADCARAWYDIQEKSEQQSFSLQFPFKTASGREGGLKTGMFFDNDHRTFQSDYTGYSVPPNSIRVKINGRYYYYADYVNRYYPVAGISYFPSLTGSGTTPIWNTLYSQNIGLIGGSPADLFGTATVGGLFSNQYPVDYTGDQKINASYAMYDIPVNSWMRVLGGTRWETTSMQTTIDSHAFNDMIVIWEPTMDVSGRQYLKETQVLDTDAGAEIKRSDLLPAFGLVFEPREKLYVRLNWSHTIARPTFKELAPVLSPVYGSTDRFIGNRSLVMSEMQNYDFRTEWYYRPGSLVAFSAFKKDIQHVIDRDLVAKGDTVFIIPINFDKATVTGVELEWRQSLEFLNDLLRDVTVGANYTRLQSAIAYNSQRIADLAAYSGNDSRAMQAQPDKIVNVNLSYEAKRMGTTYDLFYSYSGRSLVAGESLSLGSDTTTYTPSIFLDSQSSLTFGIAQKIGGHAKVGISWKIPLEAYVNQYFEVKDRQWLRSEVPTLPELSFSLSGSF